MEAHFEKQELFDALIGYLTSEERRRALLHFGRGCPECWHLLKKLAEIDSLPGFATAREWEAVAEHGAPVVPALTRCWSFLSTPGARAEGHDEFAGLRPAHLHALSEACRGRGSDERALAFRRLVLEECRHLALRERSQLVHCLKATLEELEDSQLETRCPAPMRALRALGWVYLADDYRMALQYDLTREYLAKAKADLNKDPRFKEIQATYYETVSDFARGRGNLFEAHAALDAAEKYLEMCPIPGRGASVRVRRGLVWARFGDPAQAIRGFRAALGEIPDNAQSRLRLDAWHHMAGAEVRLRRFDRAQEALHQARNLYQEHASMLMLAQRDWLWAMIYLSESRDDLAEPKLRAALVIFEKMALVIDAAQTLTELGRLHCRDGHGSKLAEATLRFVRLMNRPEARKLTSRQRRELVDRAHESGLEPFGIVNRASVNESASEDTEGEWVN